MKELGDAAGDEGGRTLTEKDLAYEHISEEFESAVNAYDTTTRVNTLIDEFLSEVDISGLETLDVGCGLGFFSERLSKRGAKVTACDIAPSLVQKAASRAACRGVVGDALQLEKLFGPKSFDLVVSSECIEHTPNPKHAIGQMAQVLRPGGIISISTPNSLWYPVVFAATRLRLRPYNGFENFSTLGTLIREFDRNGIEVLKVKGIHLFPFQLGMHRFSASLDKHCQILRSLMINLCICGRKR